MTRALILALLLAAACSKKPSTWEEWLNEAPAAWQKQDYARVFEVCSKAFDAAHATKQGAKVVLALECMAEAATRNGTPEKAFAAYDLTLNTYDADVFKSGFGLRLRNNYGCDLVNSGNKTEGIKVLEQALDAYEGSVYHSSHDFRLRMWLVTNIARTARVFTDEPVGIRVSSVILDEIDNVLVNAKFKDEMSTTLGAGDALVAIAELVRLRGDPQLARELVERAREQRAIEDAIVGSRQRRPQCQPVSIRALQITSCYGEVRG